jgi:hypothetical protein
MVNAVKVVMNQMVNVVPHAIWLWNYVMGKLKYYVMGKLKYYAMGRPSYNVMGKLIYYVVW